MNRRETIADPVLRAREIHRKVLLPRVSTLRDLQVVLAGAKARRVFEKMRQGLERRRQK